jgi:hypothetical protein
VAPISKRALGRTLLARQHLLTRVDATAVEMATQLVGMQAQEPRDPYLALWSRLEAFEPADLEAALVDRSLVRIVALRGTIHLLTADDALAVRRHVQRVLDQEMARHSHHKDALAGLDLAPVTAYARRLLREPHTTAKLKQALAEQFPDADPAALVLACRNTVPLVQVPPRGLWSGTGTVTYVTAEHWLEGAETARLGLGDLVVRYLAAFGPATVADIATWSRLTGLRAVVDGLGARLRTWTDVDGRDLFDVADGEIVDEDVPAPVRFLPEYDNVLLSHADRRRVIADVPPGLYPERAVGIGHVLVDGRVQATWRRTPSKRGPVQVTIRHGGLTSRERADVEAEANRALPLLTQGAAEGGIVLEAV